MEYNYSISILQSFFLIISVLNYLFKNSTKRLVNKQLTVQSNFFSDDLRFICTACSDLIMYVLFSFVYNQLFFGVYLSKNFYDLPTSFLLLVSSVFWIFHPFIQFNSLRHPKQYFNLKSDSLNFLFGNLNLKIDILIFHGRFQGVLLDKIYIFETSIHCNV